MGRFSVRIIKNNGSPSKDVGVLIDYGELNGTDKKKTNGDGWVEFLNHNDVPGEIWVDGHSNGNHSLANGKTYSFSI